MKDTIYREDAIKAIHNYWKKRLDTLPTKESECGEVYADIQQMDKILEHNKTLCNFINAIPSADIPHSDDWEKYSDKLWKNAYERGKEEEHRWWTEHCANCTNADRPQGDNRNEQNE